ncbi:serine/arginine repetitive matrix protein 1-like [Dromiciops gliroides]|uniref:serine/arginine repetitive matrix protein 1-like n=1 Tax=Dromiciops gliroides TaxID=33562 RepID=UPI001CC4E096|nr:serine/arginine repetitive matrix protein 1-like [Dromiciops gliroides]
MRHRGQGQPWGFRSQKAPRGSPLRRRRHHRRRRRRRRRPDGRGAGSGPPPHGPRRTNGRGRSAHADTRLHLPPPDQSPREQTRPSSPRGSELIPGPPMTSPGPPQDRAPASQEERKRWNAQHLPEEAARYRLGRESEGLSANPY